MNRGEINMLAHELRVPVTALKATLEALTDECLEKKIEFDRPYLETIGTYLDLMRHLLTRMDFVHLRPENIKLKWQRIHLNRDLIAPTIRYVRPLLQNRNFTSDKIKNKFNIDKPCIYLDKNLMQQVLFNLLDNAIKYAEPDPSRLLVNVESKINVDYYEIIISDYGIGIANMFVKHVFDEGERGLNAIESNVVGQGLGLWMAREIVSLHGGELLLTNPSHPTVFIVRLPVCLGDAPLSL